MAKKLRYSVFWGCTIPVMQPFVEKATRLVFEALNVELLEVEGATCCPDPEISRIAGPDAWLILASRNMAIAESAGVPMLVLCNGCYDTFIKALKELKESETKMGEVRGALRGLSMDFEGKLDVRHVIEALHDDVGIRRLKRRVKPVFKGVKVYIQYGCRVFRDEETKRLPEKFDKLVSLLGAEAVGRLKRLCCGVPMMYFDESRAVHERAKLKLEDAKQSEADVIVTFCPACFNMLEKAQLTLAREGTRFNIPIANYVELLAVAMGFEPDDFGAYMHRIPLDEVWEVVGVA